MRHLEPLTCCCLAALLATFGGVLGLPLPGEAEGKATEDPAALEYGEYFQGDIMAVPDKTFAGLTDPKSHWPNGEVLYEFESELSPAVRAKSQLAMSRVSQETGGCVRFREWSPEMGTGHLLIRTGSGCSASLGYDANRVTSMRLSEQCPLGSIMHEFQHVLGVEHQQNRPDRDEYVKVLFDNVRSGNELDFMKESNRYFDSYGLPYDFGSQMHYSLTAFSKNGLPTIEALPGRIPPGVLVGQRERMSQRDVALVRAMYKCVGPAV